MLDVFNNEAFTEVSMTESVNKLPYVPSRLGRLGLFKNEGITTRTAVVEEQDGKLSLLATAAPGTMPTYDTRPKRKKRSFIVPYIPANDAVVPEEVSGIVKFGTEDQLETVTEIVNDKMEALRQNHEVTHEYHRVGAIQGVIMDSDGTSVIYNLFDEFGIKETVIDIDFETDDIKAKAMEIIRALEDKIGATPWTEIRAFLGNDAWDQFIANATVKSAYERYRDNEFARVQQDREGFTHAGIVWENYRGKVGSINFIPANVARFVPIGVPNLFTHISAPAQFMDTVNTKGKVVYAKKKMMDWDAGVEIHTQSNPLLMCKRPGLLIKGVPGGAASSSSSA